MSHPLIGCIQKLHTSQSIFVAYFHTQMFLAFAGIKCLVTGEGEVTMPFRILCHPLSM